MTLALLLLSDLEDGDVLTATFDSIGIAPTRCKSWQMAFDMAEHSPPDLVLLDARSESASQIQFCKSLRSLESGERLPLIVLTGPVDPAVRLQFLEAGADDCWIEEVGSREFALRVKGLARQFQTVRPHSVLRYADVELDLDRFRARRGGRPITLSPMQMKLLRHFMENPAIMFSRRQLLSAVWGNADLEEGAVTACVVRLRRALNAAGGSNLIKSAPTAGYVFEDGDADDGIFPQIINTSPHL